MYNNHSFNAQDSTQTISFSAAHDIHPYTHTITMTQGISVPRVNFGDGFATATTILGNALNPTGYFFQNGLTSNTITWEVARLDYIKEIQYYFPSSNFGGDDGIIGHLDLSKCTRLYDELTILYHPNLTGITFPSSMDTTIEFELLRIYQNNITGHLDFSGLSNLGRAAPNLTTFQFYGNSNLTAVTFPEVSGRIAPNGRGCDLRRVELTGLTGFVGMDFSNNSNLTAITFAESAQTEVIFGDFVLHSCGFKDLDFTNLAENFGGQLELYSNTSLSSVTFPQTNNSIAQLLLYSCGFQPDYVLDLTPLGDLKGDIRVRSNNYGEVRFPATDNEMTIFQISSLPEVTHMDISMLSGISTSIAPIGNAKMTGITFSTSNNYEILGFNGSSSGLVELDMTNLTGISTTINFAFCNSLTAITMPPTDYSITLINGFDCNFLPSVDLSPMTNYGGEITFGSCGSLTAFTFGATSGTTTEILFSSCPVIPNLDLSPLGNALAGDIYVNNCGSLTSVTFPITSGTVTNFFGDDSDLGFIDFSPLSAGTQDGINIELDSNSHTFEECNQILDSIQRMGAQNGVLYLSGDSGAGTTAQGYDTTSGGINGFDIFTDLTTNSGWTIFMSGLTS